MMFRPKNVEESEIVNRPHLVHVHGKQHVSYFSVDYVDTNTEL